LKSDAAQSAFAQHCASEWTVAARVEAELQVFEGQSHAQHQADPWAPETKEYFTEVTRFFDNHLAK
jgi:hypothetical protein